MFSTGQTSLIELCSSTELPCAATRFLSDASRDVFSIFGFVGVLFTIVALIVGIWQLRRTQSAAEAATHAAVKSLRQSRDRYNRYLISQVSKYHKEARLFVTREEWALAAQRVDDVADLITQFSELDTEWGELSDRLRRFGDQFVRIAGGEITFSRSIKSNWRKAVAAVSKKISLHHGPYHSMKEISDDDQNDVS